MLNKFFEKLINSIFPSNITKNIQKKISKVVTSRVENYFDLYKKINAIELETNYKDRTKEELESIFNTEDCVFYENQLMAIIDRKNNVRINKLDKTAKDIVKDILKNRFERIKNSEAYNNIYEKIKTNNNNFTSDEDSIMDELNFNYSLYNALIEQETLNFIRIEKDFIIARKKYIKEYNNNGGANFLNKFYFTDDNEIKDMVKKYLESNKSEEIIKSLEKELNDATNAPEEHIAYLKGEIESEKITKQKLEDLLREFNQL